MNPNTAQPPPNGPLQSGATKDGNNRRLRTSNTKLLSLSSKWTDLSDQIKKGNGCRFDEGRSAAYAYCAKQLLNTISQFRR